MMRRFAPLMVCVVLALSVLVARLHEVSVEEHPIWAQEAHSLERSAHLVPYRRGRILDRQGREWVRDQVSYEIEFVWRDFRRGHALGNIAQLMSLTLMRPVDLAEVAGGDAALWADHLVSLSPKEIREFARGSALRVGGVEILGLPEGMDRAARREERRPARAEALRFYIERLLQVTRPEARRLRDWRDTDRVKEPYAALVAQLRQHREESQNAATQRLRRELRGRVDRSLVHLEELAGLVDWQDPDLEASLAAGTSLDRLVSVLDGAREESENLAADRLFLTAAGFSASQLSLEALETLDLGWLQKCLYWDGPRLEQWQRARGGRYSLDIERFVAGYVFARMQLAEGDPGHRVLDALAHEFVLPEDRPDPRKALVLPWQGLSRLRVLDALPVTVEAEIPRAWIESPVLPLQDPGLIASDLEGIELLDAALASSEEALGSRTGREQVADGLFRLPGVRHRRTDWKPGELDPVIAVMDHWNALLEARVASILQALPAPVQFKNDRVRAALEDRDHVVKDMSSRPMRFARHPSQKMVHHVERFHLDYAGLVVKSVRSRSAVALVKSEDLAEPDRLLGNFWMGKVRSPKLVSLLERGGLERQAQELWNQVDLDDEDRAFVQQAAAERFLPSQRVGGSGIEGHFDHELRGRNGIREVVGLQESRGNGARRPLFNPPQDGKDLTLTVDMDLQRAAEFVINHPEPVPPGETKYDPEWPLNPVGAIVLIRPDGQVLALASAPLVPTDGFPSQDGQSLLAINRTMRMPTFLPPGSILKPLVAAWAIEHRALNPDQPRVICHSSTTTKVKQWAGWGHVDCHNRYGHSHPANAATGRADIALKAAIRLSCNTYFAQLGEKVFNPQEFQKMFAGFGLGQPTGVRDLGGIRRGGWLEEYAIRNEPEFSIVERQRLGNGLSHLSTTPLQMARAYAGLATGNLPKIQMIAKVGDQPVPAESRPLGISDYNLQVVRDAMEEVVHHKNGTASNANLSEVDLGYRFICKTGSADYINDTLVPDLEYWQPGGEPIYKEGDRKHTWVAGWLPKEDPKLIVVVLIHDTSVTSSHGAVYVAGQILKHPAVQEYLAAPE